MKATVHVMLKPSVLDPQGEAIKKAIQRLGMANVESTRIGKVVELEISGDNTKKTREKLEEISRDLLSNPIIEDYRIDFDF